MKAFSKFTIGEGHIADHKPCQDYSLSYTEPGLSVVIVSDGHGGKPYFRSHIGAEKACYVAMDAIRKFINSTNISFFAIDGKDVVRIYPLSAKEHSGKQLDAEVQLRHLSRTVIDKWREEVKENAADGALDEWEKNNVDKEYIEQLNNPDKLYRVYGCTLIAFVLTPKYWFAMHIGDGKCFAFYDESLGKVWDEPIPWDKRCFLNKTTSLCASDAYDSFRFAYGGVGSMPLAVFLGSDGLDDTFADDDLLCDFYIKILKEILLSSQEKVESELEESLKVLSRRGSRDDMSVACLYDEDRLKVNIRYILEHQIALVSSRIDNLEKRVNELVTRKQELEHYLEVKNECVNLNKQRKELEKKFGISSNTNIEIEMGFVEKDMAREKEHKAQLLRKRESLVNERSKVDKISDKDSMANESTDQNKQNKVVEDDIVKGAQEVNYEKIVVSEESKVTEIVHSLS